LAPTTDLTIKKCFSNAIRTSDRFHVQKLKLEAFQDIRIKHRRQAIDLGNDAIEKVKTTRKTFKPTVLQNKDTVAISRQERQLLYKSTSKQSKLNEAIL
jgi:transposase